MEQVNFFTTTPGVVVIIVFVLFAIALGLVIWYGWKQLQEKNAEIRALRLDVDNGKAHNLSSMMARYKEHLSHVAIKSEALKDEFDSAIKNGICDAAAGSPVSTMLQSLKFFAEAALNPGAPGSQPTDEPKI